MQHNRQNIDQRTEIVADSSTPDLKIPAAACLVERELDPLLEGCDVVDDRERSLHIYEAGSWGPEPALDTISLPSPALGIL